ncbi:heme-binding protein [Rhizobium sp. YJ-22]|uniref:GlcG/HbpS family heme-binding protein n=1 Tax=Rhizobium sp. YJ-22 TaxID=3037556 RepID=UPI00241251B5|nr:heme-binding protein [Rhizobium sp. YJ-22]MDG3576811.1 heme-binding protein [Rhizobium sp. YJ-22]
MALVLQKASLTMDAARRIAEAAVARAEQDGLNIAVAVVDQEGAPLALLRMDGVPAPIAEFALDKAYTAAVTGAKTKDFFEHIDSSPALRLGLISRSRLLVWGGGVPAGVDGQIAGGVGVSGGPEEADIACAQHALDAVLGG